jgi:predicted aspartyl protease
MRAARSHARTGVRLAAALVVLAVARASAQDVPSEAVLADLPFLDFPEPNRVIVDLAPEGSAKPLRLMLDTGASHSVLTPLAARELGVQVRRTKQDPYRRPTRLGRDLLFYVDAQVTDTGSKTGWEYGLLGGNFLADYVVEIDFPARRVRLLDPKRYAVPAATSAPGEAVVPLRVVGQRPGVELSLNSRKFVVMLDTGAPWTAVISGELARRAEISSERIAGFEAGTAYGPMQVELADVAQLAIGPFEFSNLPLLVAPKGWYNAGFAGDSVVGYDVLSQFVLRLDYANQRMWMRRDPAAKLTLFGADLAVFRESGLLLIPKQDRFFAYLVRPDSAGARRGLRSGDWIEGMVSAEAIAKTLREGEELTVIRISDGVGVDSVLEAVESPTAVSTPPRDP